MGKSGHFSGHTSPDCQGSKVRIIMTLQEINKRWTAYKTEYRVDSPVMIEEIRFDAAKGAESSFDVTELFTEHYILHLSDKFPLYRGEYIDFILCHEFTHLADFLTHPYSYNVVGKVYNYMNTWSEYHASRRCLGMVLKSAFSGAIDPEKSVIPQPFKDISLRKLINDTLGHAGAALEEFRHTGNQQVYRFFFRYLMYLMGYLSHFENAKDILSYCLSFLKLEEEMFLPLYQALLAGEARDIIPFFDKIMKALQ